MEMGESVGEIFARKNPVGRSSAAALETERVVSTLCGAARPLLQSDRSAVLRSGEPLPPAVPEGYRPTCRLCLCARRRVHGDVRRGGNIPGPKPGSASSLRHRYLATAQTNRNA